MHGTMNIKCPFAVVSKILLLPKYNVTPYFTVLYFQENTYRTSTGWTVQGSNPGGGEIFCTCPDWPWGSLSLLYNGYRVFPGGKEWQGRDADPSPPSSAVVKKG